MFPQNFSIYVPAGNPFHDDDGDGDGDADDEIQGKRANEMKNRNSRNRRFPWFSHQ